MSQATEHEERRRQLSATNPLALIDLEDAVLECVKAGWHQIDIERELDVILDKHDEAQA